MFQLSRQLDGEMYWSLHEQLARRRRTVSQSLTSFPSSGRWVTDKSILSKVWTTTGSIGDELYDVYERVPLGISQTDRLNAVLRGSWFGVANPDG